MWSQICVRFDLYLTVSKIAFLVKLAILNFVHQISNFWLGDSFYPGDPQFLLYRSIWTVSKTAFLVNKNFAQILQKPTRRPICFGYMPKTNQIAGTAYRTSLYCKIEDLMPGSACPAPTKNENKYANVTLIEGKRQRST